MTAARHARGRAIDCYERARELLKAQSLETSRGLLPNRGRFSEMSPEQFRQASARALPPPIRVVAFPLHASSPRPWVVAEFAAELLLHRHGRRLRLAQPGERPHFRERANLRWIIWGDLIAGPGGHLALGPLSIGPYPGADTELEPGTPPYRGVTSEVLRAIPIEHLIGEIVAQLRTAADWQRHLAETHGWYPPAEQQQLLTDAISRTAQPPSRGAGKHPDDHYRDVARRYLTLLAHGQAQTIIRELADELGVSRDTARNWVHRARQLGYLSKGTRGRPGAVPGPRLQTGDPGERERTPRDQIESDPSVSTRSYTESKPPPNRERRKRSFSISDGERTIHWRAGVGFEDPTGAVEELIREGKLIDLTPTGPGYYPADRPDYVAYLTATTALREIVHSWRYHPDGSPEPQFTEEGTGWIHAELGRKCWLPPGAVG